MGVAKHAWQENYQTHKALAALLEEDCGPPIRDQRVVLHANDDKWRKNQVHMQLMFRHGNLLLKTSETSNMSTLDFENDKTAVVIILRCCICTQVALGDYGKITLKSTDASPAYVEQSLPKTHSMENPAPRLHVALRFQPPPTSRTGGGSQ